MSVFAPQFALIDAKSGKTKEEAERIRTRNLEIQKRWYANALALGSPSYFRHQRRNRANYFKRLKAKLTPTEFLTRLAKLKLRDITAYKEVCEDLELS